MRYRRHGVGGFDIIMPARVVAGWHGHGKGRGTASAAQRCSVHEARGDGAPETWAAGRYAPGHHFRVLVCVVLGLEAGARDRG